MGILSIMRNFCIVSHKTADVLFDGRLESITDCLERAVAKKTNLADADLRNANLTNATLDDAILPGADFSGANLCGANLSESNLRGTNFDGAVLYNTCLAWSDLRECKFNNTSFGATDIAGCDISRSWFAGLSCFTLNFNQVHAMQKCLFSSPGESPCPMSRPPIVINGLGTLPVMIMDRHIQAGHTVIDSYNLLALLKSHLLIESRRTLN